MATPTDHQYSAITFGVLGNIVSVLVYFAPLPTFLKIYKERSTLGFQSMPYNVAFFSAVLWLYYAFLKKNALLLVSVNSFGCVIEIFYIVAYIYYGNKRARIETSRLFCVLNVVIFPIIFALTFFIFKEPEERTLVVGWICVAISVSVFAAPLSIVFQVVQTRSVEYMPFPLSFFLTLSAVLWFAYGLLKRDLCVALPNVIGFFLGLLQMAVYGLFRKSEPPTLEIIIENNSNHVYHNNVHNNNNNNHNNNNNRDGRDKFPEHILTILVLGTPEVHPVDSKDRGDETENAKDEDQAAADADQQGGSVPAGGALSVEPSPVNTHEG